MDASAYLKRHGWPGLGHSLQRSADGTETGLKRPLLISKKVDVLGVGINKHDVIANQWWLKAFDAGLKDFGTGKKSLLSTVREHGVKRGGLYGRFVKGEGVVGTIGMQPVEGEVAAVAVQGEKRKRGDEGSGKRVKKDKRKRRVVDETSGASTPDAGTSADDRTTAKLAKRREKRAARMAEKTIDALPKDKKQQYELRAKEKGLTIEEYFARRLAKNLKAAGAT